jgi:hypothetical protein
MGVGGGIRTGLGTAVTFRRPASDCVALFGSIVFAFGSVVIFGLPPVGTSNFGEDDFASLDCALSGGFSSSSLSNKF